MVYVKSSIYTYFIMKREAALHYLEMHATTFAHSTLHYPDGVNRFG